MIFLSDSLDLLALLNVQHEISAVVANLSGFKFHYWTMKRNVEERVQSIRDLIRQRNTGDWGIKDPT